MCHTIKCITALVEPKTDTIVIAFSKALRVMISLGLISFSNKILIAFQHQDILVFSSLNAGLETIRQTHS
jgi:hypothetical protein